MTAEEELAGFVEKFAPPMQERIRACRAWMRTRFPRAVELVYDYYNFFVIGYGPTERTSEAVFSLAAYRGGVNLVFAQRATELPDPAGLLRGTGKVVRNTRIEQASDLDRPEVSALVTAAEELAARPLSDGEGPRLVIKSVSARQRPRR